MDRRPAGAARASGIELKMDMEKAIASLPKGARLAFVLHDVEGYRPGNRGTDSSVSVGTVKAQELHRARRLLREAGEMTHDVIKHLLDDYVTGELTEDARAP